MTSQPPTSPIDEQEKQYRLPYHWFPEQRLPRFFREEKQRIIFELISRNGPPSIGRYLDFGCGDGRWTSDVFDHLAGDTRAFGVDISERAIAFARLITPEIDFRAYDGNRLPFEAGSFDLITAIEVIEHVPDEVETALLEEIRRVLAPGGLLVLTTPSWNLKMPTHHFRHYSQERLSALLESSGFEVLEFRGHGRRCEGARLKLRKYMNRLPFVWKLWKRTQRETTPNKAIDLLVAARAPSSPRGSGDE
ncbi:MAG: class I SAM-dependent methyltransferase [Deltaproteobacteria bacterium]|nr:class I SAM-dependent methyltransferase [Deltaproteobacteria bacterium]